MLLFEKFGQHQPLNRQAERYAREGVPLSLSTLADQVGAGAAALMPLFKRLEAHVLAAERLHGDDTTVPVLAKGKTDTGRLWVYVRDDRPFAAPAPPGAVFYYSRDRRAEHPLAHLQHWSGILQADAYGGYGELYAADRKPAPVLEASCWAHSRRKVFELADVEQAAAARARRQTAKPISPLALEAVQRIDALFAIEREINGLPPAERRAVRKARSAPLVAELETWMLQTRDSSRAGTTWPRPSATCSAAGRPSPASSTTGGSASRTTPPSGRCGAWRSGARPGSSAARTAAVSAPPSSTA
jgi:hypothetical protein